MPLRRNLAFRAIQFDLVVAAAGRNGCTVAIDVDLLGGIGITAKGDVVIQVNFVIITYSNVLTGLSFLCIGLTLSNGVNVTDISTVVVVFLTWLSRVIGIPKTTAYVFDLLITGIDASLSMEIPESLIAILSATTPSLLMVVLPAVREPSVQDRHPYSSQLRAYHL